MGTDQHDVSKIAARVLLDTKCVQVNAQTPFILESGRASPVYVDCRRLLSFPRERGIVMDFGAEILRERAGVIDFIAGGESAGISYAAFIAERLNAPMLYVRKKPKGFGRMAQIEGALDDVGEGSEKRVVLIDDLQSDGASKRIFIEALRGAGAVVAHSLVLFHYGIFPAGGKMAAELGLKFHTLSTLREVMALARVKETFDTETLAVVDAFMAAPDEWSAAHGGAVQGGVVQGGAIQDGQGKPGGAAE